MALLPKLLSGGATAIALVFVASPHATVRVADVGPAVSVVATPPQAPANAAVQAAAKVAVDPVVTGSIARSFEIPVQPAAKILPQAPPLAPLELLRFQAAAQLYRKGLTPAADAVAALIDDEAERAALEWLALKSSGAPDGARLARFAKLHPDWPDAGWIEAVQEFVAL